MISHQKIFLLAIAVLQASSTNAFTVNTPLNQNSIQSASRFSTNLFAEDEVSVPAIPTPQTFREAEVLGLRLMQEGQYEEALKVFQNGLKLPGSRTDIIRTKITSGPSPVGGSAGGTEGKVVQTLDEFEFQAAHYNIACANASLSKVNEACASLEQAFKYGFDNYATVRADPDLGAIHGSPEFENLMERYDSKKGFFGLFK
ncbi:hypothetical protein CTEN210_01392 [Chaetoceros tenuissimus]|uniref:Uncharacterized protein n=1 Tax=Chaetoceros tenuissimus TaxID=426638 RepID=A0AAD3CFI9_9STRA|nr:hypothetical protein CTEN210_01392 [Chaetoceros tenuissimus]